MYKMWFEGQERINICVEELIYIKKSNEYYPITKKCLIREYTLSIKNQINDLILNIK